MQGPVSRDNDEQYGHGEDEGQHAAVGVDHGQRPARIDQQIDRRDAEHQRQAGGAEGAQIAHGRTQATAGAPAGRAGAMIGATLRHRAGRTWCRPRTRRPLTMSPNPCRPTDCTEAPGSGRAVPARSLADAPAGWLSLQPRYPWTALTGRAQCDGVGLRGRRAHGAAAGEPWQGADAPQRRRSASTISQIMSSKRMVGSQPSWLLGLAALPAGCRLRPAGTAPDRPDMGVHVEAGVREGDVAQLARPMWRAPVAIDVVVGLVLLQHQPHRPHIVPA